jgi:hypothetical protein
MRLRRIGAPMALVGCLLAAGCSADLFDGRASDDAGLIIFYGDTARISAPDIVEHGASFVVSFSTFGGGCIYAVARDDIETGTGRVEIRPYDRNSGSEVCTADLRRIEHSPQVRLETPGNYVIHLIGRQRDGSSGSGTRAAEITRLVSVR